MGRARKKTLSREDKLLQQSNTFGAFGRLFQGSAEQTKRKAEEEVVLAKVCAGLSQVCKMLARGKP